MQDRPIDIYVLRILLGLAVAGLAVVAIGMARTEALPKPYRIAPPPQFELSLSADGHAFEFSGLVDFGMTAALRTMVAAHPQIKRMVLDSGGGYIAEARGVVTVLREHQIDTHVEGHCASACALIFAGGSARSLAPQARIGLHGYALHRDNHFGMIDPAVEMQRDLAIYRAQSIDESFVERLGTLPQNPMWYPDHAELRSVGLVTIP